MGILKKKKIDTGKFCQNFYDKVIYHPKMKGHPDFSLSLAKTSKDSISEVDHNFKTVDLKKFHHEFLVLYFEMFALAWTHKFKSGLEQTVFTKKYLQEKKDKKIWKDLAEYNSEVGKSSCDGYSETTGKGRYRIGFVTTMRYEIWKKYLNQGQDPECAAKTLNREFTQEAFKNEYSQNRLAKLFYKRLGCKINEEGLLRVMRMIELFYGTANQYIKEEPKRKG